MLGMKFTALIFCHVRVVCLFKMSGNRSQLANLKKDMLLEMLPELTCFQCEAVPEPDEFKRNRYVEI